MATSSDDIVNVDEKSTSEQGRSTFVFKKFARLLADRWPEYIVEIIVVIIGITISFAIGNLKEKASNRTLEQMYLRSLQQDISSDLKELNRVTNQTKKIISSCQTILANSSAEQTNISKLEFVDLIRSIVERPVYISKNATFSALKSSGNFHLINDNELKNLLFEYDQQYQGMKLIEAAELQVMATITGPYFIKRIPLDTANIRVKRFEVEKIITEVEFVNNIELRLGNRKELLNNYAMISDLAKKISNLLNKHIDNAL